MPLLSSHFDLSHVERLRSKRSTKSLLEIFNEGDALMANSWKVPAWLETEVRARDTACVYCGCKFLSPAESIKASASWEHIINDETIITRENIALCCRGCNASKGQRSVSEWLSTKYCQDRGITADSVAPIIKAAIAVEGIDKAVRPKPVDGELASARQLLTAISRNLGRGDLPSELHDMLDDYVERLDLLST